MSSIAIAEHFYSIQGEGKYMGVPAVFLRLAGCNLMCGGFGTQFDKQLHNGATWRCDTIEVWTKGDSINASQAVGAFLDDYGMHLRLGAHLVITGGEPLLQQTGLVDFLDAIKKEIPHLFVEIETNGTLLPSDKFAELIDHWNVSPKLANSGNELSARCNPNAIAYFDGRPSVCFKFVVSGLKDVLEAIDTYTTSHHNTYLMPACDSIEEFNKVAPIVAEIAKDYTLNFSPRLQINLWNQTTGV